MLASTSPLPRPTRATTLPTPKLVDPLDSISEPAQQPLTEGYRDESSSLTPLRAHYLKKSLIQLQFSQEMHAITTSSTSNVSTFSYLGHPFTPPPKDAPQLDLPFLRYIFRQYVLTFPFMAAAPKNFYSEKLQPFLASVLARNISPSPVLDDDLDESERETHNKLLAKVERNLSLFLGSAIKLVEHEEVVRLSQRDLDRLEMLAKKRQSKQAKSKDVFEVNIVSVRTVTDKRRMRSKVHEEFIIRTRRSHYPDVFVSRRYGDFRTLSDELRKAHPEELVRSPPAKDKSATSAMPSPENPSVSRQTAMSDSRSSHSSELLQVPTSPPVIAPARLVRERNRLTLRSYLHSLMTSSTIASSPVLRSFLTSGQTRLSPEEKEDARQREYVDKLREDGRKRFAREIASRVEGLRAAVKSVRGDIMGKDGLTQVFATVKTTPDVRDLPPDYHAVLEWARTSLAATVLQHFVAADDSSESFASLKRIHGLMPYFMLKAALKISNPIAMIRNVLDLFLAQPFGGPSLLQRMFTSSLTEEVKSLEEEIEAVKDKVDDAVMCEKIRLFVYAPREIQDMLKQNAVKDSINILAVIMRSRDGPLLSRPQMQRVIRAQRAHALYVKSREVLADSDSDDGPQDDDAWLFEDFRVLTQLYSRLRDREQMIALVFEGFTAELLKDIITIFYAPLAQVYKAASISESLGDLQSFVNDLIKTVQQVEELSQEDSHRTVQTFINLIQRHEQAFYTFVHNVHSKGEGLFDSLMRWIERFLTVIREGLGDPISLEFLLPHTGQERANILREVDAVALYHYKLKVVYEDKIRRRFGRLQGQTNANAEDEATQHLVQGVVGEIDFGELVHGDALDLAAEESGESDDSSSESETTDDEDDDSEDDDSDESVAEPKPIHRSHTVDFTNRDRPAASPLGGKISPNVEGSRPSAFSLKMSRSMTSLRQFARHERDVPPVPPLPNNISHVSTSNPLSPSSQTLTDQTSPPPPPPPPPQPRERASRVRHKKAQVLKPPELHYLPKLLPIFMELMRPILQQ